MQINHFSIKALEAEKKIINELHKKIASLKPSDDFTRDDIIEILYILYDYYYEINDILNKKIRFDNSDKCHID